MNYAVNSKERIELLLTQIFGGLPKVNVRDEGVLVLSNGQNASITYLLEPYLATLGQPVVHAGVEKSNLRAIAQLSFHTIVIARYLPSHWVRPLRRFRAAGGRVVYFMDDDLMDPAAARDLPEAYAKKIRIMATRQRSSLESMCDEFWVATAYLAEKYRAWSPKLLKPLPALAHVESVAANTVCYHGTASHQAELEWLVPVMEIVQSSCNTHFEVFGDNNVNRIYRHLPCAAVLHPMSWQSYLAYTRSVQRDIALAPLLPSLFNAARGPTKFFDFTRMGAVGIYTDVAPYRGFIRHGIDGLLLPNEPEAWVRSILELAADSPRRRGMAQAARDRALTMAWDAVEVNG